VSGPQDQGAGGSAAPDATPPDATPPDATPRPLAPPAARRASRTDARSLLIAAASTVVVVTVLSLLVVNSPGWERVKEAFLNGEIFWDSAPGIVGKFGTNVLLFCIAEVLILLFGLLLAVLRSMPGPVFFPLRLLVTIYVDVFRAVPGILVIFLLGFGVPGLRLPGMPDWAQDPFFWGVVALTLLYSAYVSEVYRAGIESVHPSQAAAARSLGLSQVQAMRHVVVPQALRRVIPPLLNDFIGLQKDTVLVSFIGVVEIFRQTQIRTQATFNFTPYLVTALVFLVVTIPLARLTDWLVARERDRRYAAAVGASASRARRGRVLGFGR
jgi:polar amino acid transport system permease protein